MYELIIQHGGTIYVPPAAEEIRVQSERMLSPDSMEFRFVDTGITIAEGDPVRFKDGEYGVFYGFIFKIRRDRGNLVQVTAYDQIRYLKNKDFISYRDKTAGEVVSMLADGYGMRKGKIADTGWKIAYRVEDNKTLLDVIGTALDLTLQNTGDLYLFYDSFGALTLSHLGDMYVPIVIDEETGQNYTYESSIDSDTYNCVKLIYNNEKTGGKEIFTSQDNAKIDEWGILQYVDTLKEGENGQAKADALLQLYHKPTKTLTIKDACGDSRVRGGSLVVVNLDLGERKLENLMLVEKCTHRYGESKHTMDLTLAGGDFSG